jgi:hypothetical protein
MYHRVCNPIVIKQPDGARLIAGPLASDPETYVVAPDDDEGLTITTTDVDLYTALVGSGPNLRPSPFSTWVRI